eukprot:scaffold10925_cov33-Phaeocystis_antarctica.AAC.1
MQRGGQAGVVERRGAQGAAVSEGCEGGAERGASTRYAGHRAEWADWCLGGGASLGSGAHGGGCAHFERAPAMKAEKACMADWCRSQALRV